MIPALGFIWMMVIFAVWCFYLFLYGKSRRLPKKGTGLSDCFYRMAYYLLSFPCMEKLYARSVRRQLTQLYPTGKQEEICREFYARKVSVVLMASLLAVHILAGIFCKDYLLQSRLSGRSLTENGLIRGDYGMPAEEMEIQVTDGSREIRLPFCLEGNRYTKEEVRAFVNRFEKECETLILGHNESLSEVRSNLVLTDSYEGFPFVFEWESEDYALIDSDGTVYNDTRSEPAETALRVSMTYEEEAYEYRFFVRVLPAPKSAQQEWEEQVKEAVLTAQEEQKYADTFFFPECIAGKEVVFSVCSKSDIGIWCFLFALTILFLFFAKDNDLKKEITRRKTRIHADYPEFVSKFLLLNGAGMTMRHVFMKLAGDTSLSEYLRKEIQILVRDLQNGVLEKEALDLFGKRTGNPLYMKFSALLIQNLKKGNRDFALLLEEEVRESFQICKNHAKQLGEEAGTKLLVPMIMMLVIVMVILIVPAFLSFQF